MKITDTNIMHVKELSKGGHLFRLTNKAGADYSVIMRKGIEEFSCERERENAMVEYWEKEYTV